MLLSRKITHLAALLPLLLGLGCSKIPKSPGLVSTSVMGTLRGSHFVRAITHFHSPYSFDACDGKGWSSDGTISTACLHDAKYALCENHINFTFVTDHTEHIADTDFSRLLLNESGDTLLQNADNEDIATQVHCADGFGAIMVPGLEGKLLGLGMQRHIAPDATTRRTYYSDDTVASKNALEDNTHPCGAGTPPCGAGALVGIPHTESRTLSALTALAPDFIEIYNVHANLDPRIRKTYLHKKPFDKIAKFLNYLIDPYNSLRADYIFMDFFEMSQVYFDTWNSMLASGLHVTGVGGLDSHENIFSQKAADGERLDHHRRMTRFMNNLVLTTADDVATVKTAIKDGHVFFVIEGLGTPIGLDYRGAADATVVEMGTTLTIGASSAYSITLKVPSVYSQFPGMDLGESPEIFAELHYINGSGRESVVSRVSGAGATLTYNSPAAGHYRAHIYMKPHHLREFLFNQDHADEVYTWIITNPIKVVP